MSRVREEPGEEEVGWLSWIITFWERENEGRGWSLTLVVTSHTVWREWMIKEMNLIVCMMMNMREAADWKWDEERRRFKCTFEPSKTDPTFQIVVHLSLPSTWWWESFTSFASWFSRIINEFLMKMRRGERESIEQLFWLITLPLLILLTSSSRGWIYRSECETSCLRKNIQWSLHLHRQLTWEEEGLNEWMNHSHSKLNGRLNNFDTQKGSWSGEQIQEMRFLLWKALISFFSLWLSLDRNHQLSVNCTEESLLQQMTGKKS